MAVPSKPQPSSDNKTESDKVETVEVSAQEFADMQARMNAMLKRLEAADAEKAAAVKAASPITNVEDIIPDEEDEPEKTYIVYRHNYTEDGVAKHKDYRMETRHFETVCAQRGW
jgi:hypothetical protein